MKQLQRSLVWLLFFTLCQTAVGQAPSFTKLTVEKDGTETDWSLTDPETIAMREGEVVTIRIYATSPDEVATHLSATGMAGDWMYFSATQGAGSATLMLVPADEGEGDYTVVFETFNDHLELIPVTLSLPIHITDRNVLTASDTEVTIINYPNPVADVTTFEYVVPKDGTASLKLYTQSGREIITLFEKSVTAGRYYHKAFIPDLVTGTYVYRLTIDGVGSQSGHLFKL